MRKLTVALLSAVISLAFVAPVFAAGSASFSLSPASGTYTVGSNVTVTIYESSTGENANGVQANLSFSSSQLSWVSTTINGPYTLCAENSHTANTVRIGCAATTAQNGTQPVAAVTFAVVGSGTATVSMAGGSDISNTSGTSVWNGFLPSANYTVSAPSPGSAPAPAPSSPKSSSGSAKTPPPSTTQSADSKNEKTQSSQNTQENTTEPAIELGSLALTIDGAEGRLSTAQVQIDSGKAQQTNDSGSVRFAGVSAGQHTITIRAPGYATKTQTINLKAGENKIVSYTLTKSHVPVGIWISLGAVLLTAIGTALWWFWLRKKA